MEEAIDKLDKVAISTMMLIETNNPSKKKSSSGKKKASSTSSLKKKVSDDFDDSMFRQFKRFAKEYFTIQVARGYRVELAKMESTVEENPYEKKIMKGIKYSLIAIGVLVVLLYIGAF